jgi:transcriptional regulator with XRE-family HTH domain
MNDTGRNVGGDRPKVDTPLTRYFYTEWKRSGITLSEIALATGKSISTVAAVINGTRGGVQERSIPTIRAIAEAMSLDPDEAERRAGVDLPDELEQMIRRDKKLSRAQKEQMLDQYRRFTRRNR